VLFTITDAVANMTLALSVETDVVRTCELTERVRENVGNGIREAKHDALPVKRVIVAEGRGWPINVAGAPYVDFAPPRPDDPH